MTTSAVATLLGLLAAAPLSGQPAGQGKLEINDAGYFEARGLNVMVFSNWYNGLFSDSKMSGVEIIHHGERTATNGDVRLDPAPEQWDPIPQFVDRRVDLAAQTIEAFLRYPDHNFDFTIKASAVADGLRLTVHLEKPLPPALEGRAGFNLEFLPSAYFRRGYLMDEASGTFPLHPGGPMKLTPAGTTEPLPLARGGRLTLAPEDPARRVTLEGRSGEVLLYDGRNKAQNGWFVARSLIPPGKSGVVVEWLLTAGRIAGWTRPPVIAYSQVGYHPGQRKVALIELDPNDAPRPGARLLRVGHDGSLSEAHRGPATAWGRYLRYDYLQYDFSAVRDPGLYLIEYGEARTKAFRLAPDIYADAWHLTLDVYLPVQMDHVLVNEAYRVWHGASHLDDALQAPVNHEHFDLYAQGPTTDTPFAPGEHIPGLNIGGWYDAGDFDIRTQTQYSVVLSLVQAWEHFRLARDETTVDQARRHVDIHVPDGKPDVLQQIEHGTLALIAQHRALGRAIPGIVEAHLDQYTHLGDGSTKTDNLVHDSSLKEHETDGLRSGRFDDRWAFTSRSTALNYGSAAALAAASRALRGHNESLADECRATAVRVWDEEHRHPPYLFRHGNTTGGALEEEELKAAVELLLTTAEPGYARRIQELFPFIEKEFARTAALAVRVLPLMDASFTARLEARVRAYRDELRALERANPFGVPIATGGWAGSGQVVAFATTNYHLHRAFPELVGAEDVYRGLHYILGRHPDSNLSLVSGVGTDSKAVAYGFNRADFSFIPGGVVPGVLILPPDFPENMEDWPFLWGENEYVVNVGAGYLFLVNAARELLGGPPAASRADPAPGPAPDGKGRTLPREAARTPDRRESPLNPLH